MKTNKDTWTDGYKVLRQSRHSFNRGPRECELESGMCLHYPVGVKVTPKIPCSKLFAFTNFEDAVKMIEQSWTGDKFKIVKCKLKNVEPCIRITFFKIEDFWLNRIIGQVLDDLIAAPKGSIVADAIICLE